MRHKTWLWMLLTGVVVAAVLLVVRPPRKEVIVNQVITQTPAAPVNAVTVPARNTDPPTQPPTPSPAPPGVYPIGLRIGVMGDHIATLSRIEVLPDGKLKVTASYLNNSTDVWNTGCPNDISDRYIQKPNGIRVFPIQIVCQQIAAPPGASFETSIIYPATVDTTQGFSLNWSYWGRVPNIELVR